MWTYIVEFLNALIKQLGTIVTSIFNILPNSPFSDIDITPLNDYLGYLNYLVPVGKIVSVVTLWTIAIGTYYIVQIVLRWLKVIE